jgi:uncharacterized membrane protein
MRADQETIESRFELAVATLLRWGVLLAAAVILAGGIVFLWHHGKEQPHYGTFLGEPGTLRGVRGIVSEASDFRGRGLIQLGLVLLVATPIIRVALSLAVFIQERDVTYAVATAVVLLLLVAALSGHVP